MQRVTVLFKSGNKLEFQAGDESVLLTSKDDEDFGKLVGYNFVATGTKTGNLYLDIEQVEGILFKSDVTITKEPNQEPLVTPEVTNS